MKLLIAKELDRYGFVDPLIRKILLYANMRHPHTLLFRTSKFYTVYMNYQLDPIHLLRPTKKNSKFQLIVHNKNHESLTLYL